MAYSRTQYTYNGLIINDQTTDPTEFVLLDATSISDVLVENVEDSLPTDPGIVDYGSKLDKGSVVLPLTLFASTEAKMRELAQTVKATFNPELAELDTTYGEDTDYGGYLPFTWTETVGASTRNYRTWLKPVEIPKIAIDSLSGQILTTKANLKLRDPRKYTTALGTRVGSGTATNSGDTSTNVIITIVASGTTSTSLTITNTTTGEIVYVTTALTNGQTLTIDTRLHSAKLGSTESRSYLGSNTTWWSLVPGDNTITVSNDTNAVVTVSWYNAWTL